MNEWDWLDRIRVGDVLKVGPSYRVVRKVHYSKSGKLYSVTFTIMRCSWTKRCYTVLSRSDLKTRKAEKVGVRVKLCKKIDEDIRRAIETREKTLKCCDVVGVL